MYCHCQKEDGIFSNLCLELAYVRIDDGSSDKKSRLSFLDETATISNSVISNVNGCMKKVASNEDETQRECIVLGPFSPFHSLDVLNTPERT